MYAQNLQKLGDIISKNLYWFIMPMGVTGNLLIIAHFIKINVARNKKLSKMNSNHFLIIQLAVVDLIICIAIPILFREFYEPTWRWGWFGCIIALPILIQPLPYISLWILVLISYERYRSITKPFVSKATKCQCSIAIMMIMLSCCFSFVPYMLNTRLIVDDQGSTQCLDALRGLSSTYFVPYLIFLRVLDCFLPSSLMYFFYRRIRNWMNEEVNRFPLTEESKRRNKLALKTLRNLIIVYIACVFPGRLVIAGLNLEDRYRAGGTERVYYFYFVQELFSLIALFNYVVNVFVYAVMIKDFRKFILTLITFGRLWKYKTIHFINLNLHEIAVLWSIFVFLLFFFSVGGGQFWKINSKTTWEDLNYVTYGFERTELLANWASYSKTEEVWS